MNLLLDVRYIDTSDAAEGDVHFQVEFLAKPCCGPLLQGPKFAVECRLFNTRTYNNDMKHTFSTRTHGIYTNK